MAWGDDLAWLSIGANYNRAPYKYPAALASLIKDKFPDWRDGQVVHLPYAQEIMQEKGGQTKGEPQYKGDTLQILMQNNRRMAVVLMPGGVGISHEPKDYKFAAELLEHHQEHIKGMLANGGQRQWQKVAVVLAQETGHITADIQV